MIQMLVMHGSGRHPAVVDAGRVAQRLYQLERKVEESCRQLTRGVCQTGGTEATEPNREEIYHLVKHLIDELQLWKRSIEEMRQDVVQLAGEMDRTRITNAKLRERLERGAPSPRSGGEPAFSLNDAEAIHTRAAGRSQSSQAAIASPTPIAASGVIGSRPPRESTEDMTAVDEELHKLGEMMLAAQRQVAEPR